MGCKFSWVCSGCSFFKKLLVFFLCCILTVRIVLNYLSSFSHISFRDELNPSELVDSVHEVLVNLKETFTQTKTLDPSRTARYHDEFEEIFTSTLAATKIGVYGDTGAGKSSLLNAVLEEEQILPTSGYKAG